jgi:hypothetical protein
MPTPSKHDYPALIEEYERRLASGEEHKAILADFSTRGVHPGTFQNRRTQARKTASTEKPSAKGTVRRKSQKVTATTTAADTGEKKMVRLEDIIVRDEIQQRVKMSNGVIDEYRELMVARGEEDRLPPVVLFTEDGQHYLLSEGFHRYYAAKAEQFLEIEATIHQGWEDEAIDYACSANIRHGLRPTKEDKQKAVTTQLTRHPERADREIARICGVSPSTVGAYRDRLYPPEPPQATTHETGVQLDTDHDTQPTQSPETREPVQVDTSTVNHEPHEPPRCPCLKTPSVGPSCGTKSAVRPSCGPKSTLMRR